MVSELAFVHPGAKLGENVTVEAFAYIADDVVIGEGTWVGPHATVLAGTRMGKNCKIHPNAVVGGVPQDLKFRGEYTTLEMGDNNTVREGASLNRGTAARGKTVIGSNNLFMACCHVGHDCVIGDYCVIVNNVLLAGEVEVGDWVVFGGQGGAVQFSRIGSHVMVGAGTFVNKDIPPFVKASHEPIQYAGANTIGLRRRGFTDEQVHNIQEIFRIIFQSGYTYGKACDIVMEQFAESTERDAIINFIKESKRGILKPWSSKKNDEE